VSGRWRQDAVVISTVAGERYVVSMFGTISDWVCNVEAANGDAAISHGGRQRVRLVPVPPEQRAPILSEYVRVASSGRKHFPLSLGASLAEFAAIASQYPVYRIEPPALGPVRRYALRWLIGDLDARGIIRLLPDDVTRQGYLERAYTLGREF
jgi:hypothetical protein